MNISPLREVSNPAAVGWEWAVTYDASVPTFEPYPDAHLTGEFLHQISWTRGTNNLHYGTKIPGGKNWTNTLIVAPERFGFEGTLDSARIAAQAFYEESTA